jgi:hypothetical protein
MKKRLDNTTQVLPPPVEESRFSAEALFTKQVIVHSWSQKYLFLSIPQSSHEASSKPRTERTFWYSITTLIFSSRHLKRLPSKEGVENNNHIDEPAPQVMLLYC